LTGYNSEYSDRPFPEKRDISGGFNESPLKLNKGLGQLDNWNEDTIKDRAERLSKIAVKVWELPQLSDDVLAAYKPAPEPGAYGIVDHPQLAEGKMKELFDALRKEVLAIDPCVTEEFLKLYIAYKAETNFVDVIPQAKRLLLSLNLKFSELIDPRGISKDMTGIGRWGNGDVQVPLTSVEDIPYAIGLVRQAFEVQMGADVEA
jgi:predicted transport protein